MTKILKLEELSQIDYKNLDRYKTVIFINLSPIENHGPHLPLGMDILESGAIIKGLTQKFKENYPDWNAVVCPDITMGVGTMLGQGSIKIRQRVLRDFLIDYLGSFTKRGFKHLVVSGFHGEFRHLATIDEAVGYINRKYDVKVISPFGYYISNILSKKMDMNNKELNDLFRSNVGDVHGGMIETSFMLHIRPDLVKDYKGLKRINIMEKNLFKKALALKDAAKSGYFGNPAVATPEIGEMILNESINNFYHVLDKSIKEPDFANKIKSIGNSKFYLKTDFLRYLSLALFIFSGLFFVYKRKSKDIPLEV